jgi:hypothetical protein
MNIKLHDGQEIVTDKIVFNNIGGRSLIGYFSPGNKKPTYFCVEEVKWVLDNSGELNTFKSLDDRDGGCWGPSEF